MAKGDETRERILEHAYRVATREGLNGLTIGSLSSELQMSKSGLFAHFGSKEDLQIAVLQAAADLFTQTVIAPAFQEEPGEPRVRALFENWLHWLNEKDRPGGCLFLAASTELDDQEGRTRDFLEHTQRLWFKTIVKAVHLAINVGHFRRGLEGEQFAFELQGIVMAYHHHTRLLRDRRAERLARAAFERLIGDSFVPPR